MVTTEREEIELIVFPRGAERYGLESRHIQEIVPLGRLTVLPGVPAPVVGVAAWRGEILVVVDASGGVAELPVEPVVLAVADDRVEFGIVADAVGELERMAPAAVKPAAEGVAAGRVALRGVTASGVQVLDGDELIRIHTQRSGS